MFISHLHVSIQTFVTENVTYMDTSQQVQAHEL